MSSRGMFIAAAVSLAASFAAAGGSSAAAASVHSAGSYTCSGGTNSSPQSIPAGTYSSILVTSTGTCLVEDGPTTVTGDVTVDPGGFLGAVFAAAPLTVDGNVSILRGAASFLGCEPNFFPCFDNGNAVGKETIKGSLMSTNALTVVLHQTTVRFDVRFLSGGGGISCGPSSGNTPAANFLNAPFGQSNQGTPAYFDNEDNTVDGNVWITNLQSCWVGSLRNAVGGSFVAEHNVMADPDAGEVLANHIAGNLLCAANNPAPQFGDSGSTSDIVAGTAQGQCGFGVKQPNPAPNGTRMPISVLNTAHQGYDLGAADGGVFNFGTKYYGSAVGFPAGKSWTGIATAPGPRGYWQANGDGTVVPSGPNAFLYGDASKLALRAPIVGIAGSPWGNGYYLAGGDGGVFAFGPGSKYYGSASNLNLKQPIVGIAATRMGDGYFLVGADGGVFGYGPGGIYKGSVAGTKLAAPIVGIAVDPATGGYWLAGADGGVFGIDAPYLGSEHGLSSPVVGIVAAPAGNGYYLVTSNGAVYAIGKGASYQGGANLMRLAQPIVGMGLG